MADILRRYLDDMSDKLHMREIPHKTVVGSLDDVAGIMRSVRDLGVQAIPPPGPDIVSLNAPLPTARCNINSIHLSTETAHAIIIREFAMMALTGF